MTTLDALYEVCPDLYLQGTPSSRVLVITDPPPTALHQKGLYFDAVGATTFAVEIEKVQLDPNRFMYVGACPYIPESVWQAGKTQQKNFALPYRSQLVEVIKTVRPAVVVLAGPIAAMVFYGKTVASKSTYGTIANTVYKYPLRADLKILETDNPPDLYEHPVKAITMPSINEISKTTKAKQGVQTSARSLKTALSLNQRRSNYRWCTDIQHLLDNPPELVAWDTETTGLDWWDEGVYPFLLQIATSSNDALAIPLHKDYYPELERDQEKLLRQVKQFLENTPTLKVGHNLKFDFQQMYQSLKIMPDNNYGDTMVLAWHADENQPLNLDDVTRREAPALGCLNDDFNATVDKANMINVPYDKILEYGCNDVCMTFAVYENLARRIHKDIYQWNIYQNVHLPAIKTAAFHLEKNGLPLPRTCLDEAGRKLEKLAADSWATMLKQIPEGIKEKYGDKLLDVSLFNKNSFLRDLFFSEQGLGLKPKVFTGTGDISVSIKEHLNHFVVDYPLAAEYTRFSKIRQTIKSCIGNDEDPKKVTGYKKYIYNDYVRPSYNIVGTVTGRASSSKPNGQNIPQHGDLAVIIQSAFKAPDGWLFVKADYSQLELRLMAEASQDPEMCLVYLANGDIHKKTAITFSGLSEDGYNQLAGSEQKKLRQGAKGGNFGLAYKVSVEGYMDFAFNTYGVVLTREQAEQHMTKWYGLYRNVRDVYWKRIIAFTRKHGYARSLVRHKRHLPEINSHIARLRSEAERLAINNPIQGAGGLIGLAACNRIAAKVEENRWHDRFKLCGFIHDATVSLVREDYLEEGSRLIKWGMEEINFKELFLIDFHTPLCIDFDYSKSLSSEDKVHYDFKL